MDRSESYIEYRRKQLESGARPTSAREYALKKRIDEFNAILEGSPKSEGSPIKHGKKRKR